MLCSENLTRFCICLTIASLGTLVSVANAQNNPSGSEFEQRLNQFSPATSTADADVIELLQSPVRLIGDVEVPALEMGQIKAVHVQEGNRVQAGMVLAELDNAKASAAREEARLNHVLAQDRANDESSIVAAAAKIQFHNSEYRKIYNLYLKNSESESRYQSAKAQLEVAQAEHQKAIKEKAFAALQADVEQVKFNAMDALVKRHELTSPIDGIVVEVKSEAGEWVNAGDPVFRIVQIDKLRVTNLVSASQYRPSDVSNRNVTVQAILPGFDQPVEFTGKVVFANIEQYPGQFEVWAEIENRQDQSGNWLLMPGTETRMLIHLK